MSKQKDVFTAIKNEIHKTVIGQDEVIDLLLVTLLSGSHAIIEGVPGLAKTLLINSLARSLDLSFNRIQFTPDMVPSDITGTEILSSTESGDRQFRFVEGPVFSNIVLADEINRTPPKTQSALLQSMQEREVTLLGKTYSLPEPFYVLATQNPIEYEGTYPLPEAQLDRFLLHIYIGYPTVDEEIDIVDVEPENIKSIKPVMNHRQLTEMMERVREMPVADKVKAYAVEIVRNTRPQSGAVDAVRKYVEWGAGPRASQMLVRAARAFSYIHSKPIVDKQDIDDILIPCLKHRVILNYHANADGVSIEDLIREIRKESEKKI